MRVGGEDPRNACQAACGAGSTYQQQRFAAKLVDNAHADDGEDKIGESDGDGLLITGELAESGSGKDIVQVVEDCIDACELIERADGDGEKERVAIFPAEDGFVRGGVLLSQRGANV